MHARELLELAAVVASQGGLLARNPHRLMRRGPELLLERVAAPPGWLEPALAAMDRRGPRPQPFGQPRLVAVDPQRAGGNPHRRVAHEGLGRGGLCPRSMAQDGGRGSHRAQHFHRPSGSAPSRVESAGARPRDRRRARHETRPSPPPLRPLVRHAGGLSFGGGRRERIRRRPRPSPRFRRRPPRSIAIGRGAARMVAGAGLAAGGLPARPGACESSCGLERPARGGSAGLHSRGGLRFHGDLAARSGHGAWRRPPTTRKD